MNGQPGWSECGILSAMRRKQMRNRQPEETHEERAIAAKAGQQALADPVTTRTVNRCADKHFERHFQNDCFGTSCSVCDVSPVQAEFVLLLAPEFSDENVRHLVLCAACRGSLDNGEIPSLSRSNGLTYPPKRGTAAFSQRYRLETGVPVHHFHAHLLPHARCIEFGLVGQAVNVPRDGQSYGVRSI
ncbi:hypothetical protein HPB49_004964 [Dermacentor silvarum]|uniref:Uncharacterized protein n=1 Tax=Dermacentor silvarum TaxID=543639 RepID=A0ACB8CJA6_DERSI|nr:hypothetical protein HPB49_004964 [Dermacentor silvarum]